MARTEGPLLSETASGSIGGVLTFQKGYKGQQCHTKLQKSYKKTNAQVLIRSEFGMALADWRIATQEIKDAYNELAKGKKLTGYDLFVKDYLYLLRESVYGVAVYDISAYG